MEVWKVIDGYSDRYEVSNYGRVRSKDMVVMVGCRIATTRKGEY